MIKYAVFDLDGTLLDTRCGVISAAVQTIKLYKKEVPNKAELKSLIGPPMQKSFQNLYGLSGDEAMEMSNQFREYYKSSQYLFRADPYKNIYNVLTKIKKLGIEVGIATYKREDYALTLLKEKGFDRYTPFIYGSDFDGKKKKSEIICGCLYDMGCMDAAESVYIGDGESDGIGAKEVGMNFIAVTYGFGFKYAKDAAAYNPIGVAENCDDIWNIIYANK